MTETNSSNLQNPGLADLCMSQDSQAFISHSSSGINIIGDVTVVYPEGTGLALRRDVFLEPTRPPQISVLTDKQVIALQTAAFYKRQPTHALAAIPLQFAREYNQILRGILPKMSQAGIVPFGFISNLSSSRVQFGYIAFTRSYNPEENIPPTQLTLGSADRDMELGGLSLVLSHLRLRLFPPGLGSRVHAYEKGYYVDGTVKPWKEVVYKGRYISADEFSPQQLQDFAKGEQPYPVVEYLPESEFSVDIETIRKLVLDRVLYRAAHDHIEQRFGWSSSRFADCEDNYKGGDFDEDSLHRSLPQPRNSFPSFR